MLKAKSACACRCGRVTRSSRPLRIAARSVCPRVRDQDETTISRTDGSVQSHRQTEFSVGRSGSRLFARVPQANGQVGVGGIVDADLADPAASILVGVKAHAPTTRMPLRMAGVPARAVSRAVNSCTGMNLSQWIDHARIDAVCRDLRVPGTSSSDAMLAAGFLTKFNFNREFRRMKGCSTSEWREAKQELARHE